MVYEEILKVNSMIVYAQGTSTYCAINLPGWVAQAIYVSYKFKKSSMHF